MAPLIRRSNPCTKQIRMQCLHRMKKTHELQEVGDFVRVGWRRLVAHPALLGERLIPAPYNSPDRVINDHVLEAVRDLKFGVVRGDASHFVSASSFCVKS